ncbi:MAG: signal peptidase I [Bacteroidia bacterium]
MSVKSKVFIIVGSILVLFAGWFLLRYFRVYAVYKLPTCNMDPYFYIDQTIFASSLLKTQKGDVVVYMGEALPNDATGDSYEVVGRIVAAENDTVQLINGILYVNGVLADDTMNLNYHFILPEAVVAGKLTEYQEKYMVHPYYGNWISLNTSYANLMEMGAKDSATRTVDGSMVITPLDFGVFTSELWNYDNFGPVAVPEESYFILGDNRSNSADSRLRGFIHKDKIIAKIVTGNQ